MELSDILARNVRRMRNETGMSQDEFADAVGIDRTYVSGIERGVRNPTIKILDKLSAALNVPPHELLAPPRK